MKENTVPFEIHLTTRELASGEAPVFRQVCAEAGVKPLLIELAKGDSKIQPMVSFVVNETDLNSALETAGRQKAVFIRQGFPIHRTKVEIPAKLASFVDRSGVASAPYFEWHGKVDFVFPEQLEKLCIENRAHLSKNSLQKEGFTRFVTLREYGSGDVFNARVKTLSGMLEKEGWKLHKQEFEYCIYDDRVALDSGWLPA